MSADRTEQLMDAIRGSRVLEKLDEMARTQTGTKLIVLLPAAEDVSIPVQANLIIELCSK